MRNFILTTLFFIGLIAHSSAQYQKGVEAYKSNNFAEAIDAFKSSNDTLSYEWQYNIANAYYKNRNLGLAILHWNKALRLKPGYTNAIENLEIASAKIVDKIDASPSHNIASLPSKILGKINPSLWGIAALLFALIAVVLFVFNYHSNDKSQKPSIILGLLAIVFIVLGLWNNTILTSKNHAIIIEQEVDVQTEPALSTTAFVLHEGTKVEIINREGDWLEIEIPSGNSGWLLKETLGII